MINSRAHCVLEDYFQVSREKGYWCRLGEERMMAREYIILDDYKDDIFIPINMYHFALAHRFRLHLLSLTDLVSLQDHFKLATAFGNQEDFILYMRIYEASLNPKPFAEPLQG